MKKQIAVFVSVLFILAATLATGEERNPYFFLDKKETESKPDCITVYMGDRYAMDIPVDWTDARELMKDVEPLLFLYRGTDEDGHAALVGAFILEDNPEKVGAAFDSLSEDMPLRFESSMYGAKWKGAANDGNAMMLSESGDDGMRYMVMFATESEPLSEDFLSLLRTLETSIRPQHDGEQEYLAETAKLQNRDLSTDEEPVSFYDAEFERMVRMAMKRETEPIYPSELAAVRLIAICTGKLSFRSELLDYDRKYEQPMPLSLRDLCLFPNLRTVYLCDVETADVEALTELRDLGRLTMIRTGSVDPSLFAHMNKLTYLDICGSAEGDLTPLSTLTGLRSLNITSCRLRSLEVVSRLTELEDLTCSSNPITDLSPLAGLRNLRHLRLAHTFVSSLEPLRGLTSLESLDLSEIDGRLSLEPLFELPALRDIYVRSTSIEEESKSFYEPYFRGWSIHITDGGVK